MKMRKTFCLQIVCLLCMVFSVNSRGQELHETIMDSASSAIVENVVDSGNGIFSFSLRSAEKDRNLTDQGKLGERSRLVLKFNADTLNGTQVVVHSEDEYITSETLGLSGRRFLSLLISRMQSQTPISLTFSVVAQDQAALESRAEFEIVYFQWNSQ